MKSEKLGETLGSRVKKLRLSNGLNLDQLAKKVNVTRQAVAKWESDRSQPKVKQLQGLARHFGVSPPFLAFGVADPDRFDDVELRIVGKLPLLTQEQKNHVLNTINLLAGTPTQGEHSSEQGKVAIRGR